MKDINKIILVGRLGADPIQRQTKNGFTVVHFSVATSRRYSREDSNSTAYNSVEGTPEAGNVAGSTLVEETQWHRVVVWGKQAEACSAYLKKGNLVYVEGYLRTRQYEDKNGQPKTNVEVNAETISFLGGKRNDVSESRDFSDTAASA